MERTAKCPKASKSRYCCRSASDVTIVAKTADITIKIHSFIHSIKSMPTSQQPPIKVSTAQTDEEKVK